MKAVRDMGLRTGKGKGKNIALEYQVTRAFRFGDVDIDERGIGL